MLRAKFANTHLVALVDDIVQSNQTLEQTVHLVLGGYQDAGQMRKQDVVLGCVENEPWERVSD